MRCLSDLETSADGHGHRCDTLPDRQGSARPTSSKSSRRRDCRAIYFALAIPFAENQKPRETAKPRLTRIFSCTLGLYGYRRDFLLQFATGGDVLE